MTCIEFDDREVLDQAVGIFADTSFDLEDAYNIAFAQDRGVEDFCTFDKKALQYFEKNR